jgi:16S rRNA (guanine1207-N2)-methyltransferase
MWSVLTPKEALIQAYSNKRCSMRFAGCDLQFDLSQELFSSFSIDAGSNLLLKNLIQQIPLENMRKALDFGCGIGTLGIALAKKFPEIAMYCTDRDAMALEWTRHNAELNGVQVSIMPSIQPPQGETFDLIVTNIPAKAGNAVIEQWLSQFLASLSKGGRLALVIVQPLRSLIENELSRLQATVLNAEHTKQYSVFIVEQKDISLDQREQLPSVSIRERKRYYWKKHSYTLNTVHGLKNFDTQPFALKPFAETLPRMQSTGNIFLWSPDQGHWASLISSIYPALSIEQGSRDLLALENNKNQGLCSEYFHIPAITFMQEMKEKSYDGICFFTGEGQKQVPAEIITIKNLLKDGCRVLICGPSSQVQMYLHESKGLVLEYSKKYRGYRSIILRKNP